MNLNKFLPLSLILVSTSSLAGPFDSVGNVAFCAVIEFTNSPVVCFIVGLMIVLYMFVVMTVHRESCGNGMMLTASIAGVLVIGLSVLGLMNIEFIVERLGLHVPYCP